MQGNSAAAAADARKGYFGSAVSFSSADYRKMCRMDTDSDANRLCSTWSNYLPYNWAMNSSLADERYRFNQWHEEELFYELHLTCNYNVPASGICGGFYNTVEADKTYRGVIIKNVKLQMKANSLFPAQSDLDFIICFRFTELEDNLIRGKATTLASAGLVNVQVLTFRNSTTITLDTAEGTFFRIGIVNWY